MIKAVVLKKSGNINDIDLKITKKNITRDIKTYFKTFKKYLDKKNKHTISLIDVWNINEFNLIGYGFNKGDKNNINKHELLITENNNKYYGDILLIKTNKNNIIDNLTSTEYEKLYNKFYGYYQSDDDSDGIIDDIESDNVESSSSYDEMYDSDNISVYHTDESDNENIDVEKQNIQTMNNSYFKELEYESYSSESD